ncbi:hypothetical protein MGG_15115 [Pyricularia oryzae 70-15]|uniref:Uncharacterized protein n=1 Tax=Pyricularia oryzae (strain 70-15 / ATCC MYA-4617 / FGSC 8958) TaxID=242507 RepID=G4N294_PYRO7|nr:uncharacterized protein MGG_15115 [Pyricularia oryzae 70-15]EHA52506.1 hypothetical protein MGG_15115 [Pyricularia oryzae 70-15]KAI7912108.1 hypothetical protein M9X92_010194 [Pyricularia oryzae]KAI7914245.1 hypothetical protein M0657_009596 [Pyricularia oryzae]
MTPSFILISSTFQGANSLHLPKDYIKYNLMECCKQALRAVPLPNPISLCCSQRREICNAPSGFGFVLSLRELASCHTLPTQCCRRPYQGDDGIFTLQDYREAQD